MNSINRLSLVNSKIVFPKKDKVEKKNLVIEGEKIKEITEKEKNHLPKPNLDLENQFLVPGFIDLQVNGAVGVDFLSCRSKEIDKVCRFLFEHGTTSFLGTVITNPPKTINRAIRRLARSKAKNLMGIHLEGPFLSEEKRGTHNQRYLAKPKRETFEKIIEGFEDSIELVTYAPELEGSLQLFRAIRDVEAKPSIGHTAASYDQTVAALRKGVNCFTHLFNGMKGFHHRNPGPVAAALNFDAFTGIIADKMHLHPAAVNLTKRAKDSSKVYLVTDSIAGTGLPDGNYDLGEQKITVKDGLARIENGTIAGSTLTLERAGQNYMNFTGASLIDTIKTMTINPATLLGVDDQVGSLEPGTDADLVVIDEDWEVKYTIKGGKIVYQNEH